MHKDLGKLGLFSDGQWLLQFFPAALFRRGGEALEGAADLGTETGTVTARKEALGMACSPACTALTSNSILLQRRDMLSEKGLLPAQKSLWKTPEKNQPSTTPLHLHFYCSRGPEFHHQNSLLQLKAQFQALTVHHTNHLLWIIFFFSDSWKQAENLWSSNTNWVVSLFAGTP